jgi:hypothetical protein
MFIERKNLRKRFLEKVRKTQTCWIWLGCKEKFGHGHIKVNRKVDRASRVSWQLFQGQIPVGVWVLHKCHNPPCVNPAHLYLGNLHDNARDRASRGSTQNRKKLTSTIVIRIRKEYAANPIYASVARKFNVSSLTVKNVVTRRTWKEVN